MNEQNKDDVKEEEEKEERNYRKGKSSSLWATNRINFNVYKLIGRWRLTCRYYGCYDMLYHLSNWIFMNEMIVQGMRTDKIIF